MSQKRISVYMWVSVLTDMELCNLFLGFLQCMENVHRNYLHSNKWISLFTLLVVFAAKFRTWFLQSGKVRENQSTRVQKLTKMQRKI